MLHFLRLLLPVCLLLFSCTLVAGNTDVSPSGPVTNEKQLERGKQVYKKSNCAFCHGWTGDGRGHPRSPGAAANLRTSKLDEAGMKQVIRCGIPGSHMPYHDRLAYMKNLCVVSGAGQPNELLPQKGSHIREQDLDALVSFIQSAIQGNDRVTLEQCEFYYKPGSANCAYLR